jgi:hypothetical protein
VSTEYLPLFIPFKEEHIEVRAGQTTTLNIHLKDGQSTLGDGGGGFVKLIAEQPAPKGPAPRTCDRKPDLSGAWLPNIARPVGEMPKPLPWADALAKERGENFGKGAPMARCLARRSLDGRCVPPVPTRSHIVTARGDR